MPSHYRLLFSDAGGNNERLTFIYDWRKVTQLEEIGELALAPADLRNVKLPGSTQRFEGFDRNPYLALFSGWPSDIPAGQRASLLRFRVDRGNESAQP